MRLYGRERIRRLYRSGFWAIAGNGAGAISLPERSLFS